MAKSNRHVSFVDGLVMILLCLLVLAFYRHIALSNQILPGIDAFTYFYPYRHYAAEVIRSGQVPLWNPYLFMGVPFVANAQTAVFYPLNLALCWLDGPRLVTWSIVIHVTLAALSAYLYARLVLRLSPLAALLGAGVFAFGGFLSGMVEHVNQLNVSAWFPLLLLLWERSRRETRFLYLLGIVAGIGLLAGHTQSSYICLFGLGVYAALATFSPRARPERRARLGDVAIRLWHVLWQLALVVLVGVLLAAVQLVPTIELSTLSIRGGGLSYRQAVAFSLTPLPRLLRYTFLPPWGTDLAGVFGGDFFTEYVAYVGLIPLVLVVGWLGGWGVKKGAAWKKEGMISLHEVDWRKPEIRLLILAGLGAFLAIGGYNPLYWVLYKLVPGFGLFRVPARWLFLYAFGTAMLAGVGLQKIWECRSEWKVLPRNSAANNTNRHPAAVESRPTSPNLGAGCAAKARNLGFGPLVATLVVGLALIELFVASRSLPLAHPTAPEAFSSLRTAPAHILAAQNRDPMPGRFLSMSDILFDPGDQREMEHMFAGQLDDKAIYDLVVSAKRKEILAPNLPLAWRVYAVDGYDGGVLPLQRYVDLQTLFVPPEAISPDGRLRENLARIPPSRLLSLLGVRYVITDKVHDAWIDDVFYDLTFEAVLGPAIATTDLPDLAANALGVVAYIEETAPGGAGGENGMVAEIRLVTADRPVPIILPLYAGDVAARAAERQAARLRWNQPRQIERLKITSLSSSGTLHVRGLTLIDERDGSSVPVLLSSDGQVRLVHSGDVKVYEVTDVLPRAYVVHEAIVIEEDADALAALANPAFDPEQQVILHSDQAANLTGFKNLSGLGLGPAEVTTSTYEPEQIGLQVTLPAPGYLVLSDAYYPGWKATVDGAPAEIVRANVHFRAVFLSPGTHVVEFTYKPASYYAGLSISIAASAGFLAALAIAIRRSRIAVV